MSTPPVIGVLGAGQLGRMLAMAGHRLGQRFRFLDEAPDAVAGHVGELVIDSFTEPARLDEFLRGVELVTYEFENVPVQLAETLARRVKVYPGVTALATSQDRLSEKTMFAELGIGTPPFAKVDSLEELRTAVAKIGLPAVLKTRRLGYDGKGQAVLRAPTDIDAAWHALQGTQQGLERGEGAEASSKHAVPLILEGFVSFQAEVSILAARSATGQVAFYPLTENVHEGGILRISRCPAGKRVDGAKFQDRAEQLAEAVLKRLDYVGLLAIELFVVGNELLANEMAPRVHNSGHWTMDGSRTSQFEQHLRAIMGWPLGATQTLGFAGMVNLIGRCPELGQLAAVPGARVHWYAKQPRPGRKVGHINVLERTQADLEAGLVSIVRMLEQCSDRPAH